MLLPGEKVIVSQKRVSAGNVGGRVRNAYDLYLVETSKGLTLVVFMKVQFFFKDNNSWTTVQKVKYVRDWEDAIKKAWVSNEFTRLKNGKKVALEFRFKTQIAGWMWDHWEINVSKIGKGEFDVSSVDITSNEVKLDSEDLTARQKRKESQRGAVHEFGHMIGLEDEYTSNHRNFKDYPSVMNRGEGLRKRHGSGFIDWLSVALHKNGIK